MVIVTRIGTLMKHRWRVQLKYIPLKIEMRKWRMAKLKMETEELYAKQRVEGFLMNNKIPSIRKILLPYNRKSMLCQFCFCLLTTWSSQGRKKKSNTTESNVRRAIILTWNTFQGPGLTRFRVMHAYPLHSRQTTVINYWEIRQSRRALSKLSPKSHFAACAWTRKINFWAFSSGWSIRE